MRVLQILNNEMSEGDAEHRLENLKEEFGIKWSNNENYPNLYCLNYDQINSPKNHPVTNECRSLVLRWEDEKFYVESRSFDRFFNYGEIEGDDFDITQCVVFEKIDGSLLNVWYSEHYGKVLYRTRSMIMPEDMPINGHEITWAELIERNIKHLNFVKRYTYIFELVSNWNRVVTKYDSEGVYLLACRNNLTGEYANVLDENFVKPKMFQFNSYSNILKAAKELTDLKEGYVLYQNRKPVLKIKSPAYVAAHKLRSEGTPNPKRIMDLIIENEQDEYLAIFPEDKDLFEPYIQGFNKGLDVVEWTFSRYNNIEDQKEFAMTVKDMYYAPLLFGMRKSGSTAKEQFYKLLVNGRYNFILKSMEEL